MARRDHRRSGASWPAASRATAPSPTRWPSPARSRRRWQSRCRRARIWLRALMAELERLANHLGDIGAICNDASFSLMHAHCGVLREQMLRAADACFGHRLMMDRVVPGGVAADLAAGRRAQRVAALLRRSARRFPDAGRALRQHGLAAGSHRRHRHPARRAGPAVRRRRLCRPRLAAAISTRARRPAIRRTISSPSTCRFCEGDVNARVWIRIREVEQSLGLIEQILSTLPGGAIRTASVTAGGTRRRHGAGRRAFRGDVWSGSGSKATAASSAATCATRPGSSGRCWKR